MRTKFRRVLSLVLAAALILTSGLSSFVVSVAAADSEVQSIVREAESYDSKDGSMKTMSDSAASGGKYVGDFAGLRTISFNIHVEKSGNYEVIVRGATQKNNAKVFVNCSGSFSEELAIPNTGGWQKYMDLVLYIWMEEGDQVVTVTNTSNDAWNVDKITLNYLNDEVKTEDLKEYSSVYLQNRWKAQRLVERDGTLAYADSSDEDYMEGTAAWDLIPDGFGFYEIRNWKTGNYIVMTEGTDVVGMSAEGGTDAGKWQIGTLGGRLEFFNKLYTGACITLEYQADYPGQVLTSTESLAKWYSSQWEISVPEFAHEYEIGADYVSGTAGTATAVDGTSITVDQNGSTKTWTLSKDISGAPVFTAESMPMMEAVYNLTMEETYKNIHNGTYGEVFWTGTNWSKVWTRDSAMSEQYSLAWIFPEQTRNSIMEKIVGGDGMPQVWEEDTGTGGSYPTSVDRVIMMIACWEYYKSTGDEEFLELAYDVTKNTLEQDYHVAYDEISGLMTGETGGLDHRDKTYPDWMSETKENSIVNIAESKAGNANIVFAQTLNLMAQAGQILGKDEAEIADWEAKYEDLKTAINERLWLEDRGMYASWEYPEYMGSPVADKVDVIANGYAVMFGIGDEEQTQSILENYPLVVYGANTVWPQKTGRQFSTIYHNRGVWPGWEATLMIGAKENGNNQVADEIFKSCVRGAAMSLSNMEVIDYATGEGLHSTQQLWSVAATLAGYYRVLFGMTYENDGIHFAPYVPEWMEGDINLSNYAYRNAVLDITVVGTGDTVEAMSVNGETVSADYVLPADASGEYEIVIVLSDSGIRSPFHLEEDSWYICPELPVLTENADGTLAWEEEEGLTYKLWTGSEFVEVSGGSYTPDRTVYGAYSLVSVNGEGITSEMSEPIVIRPEGSVKVYEAEEGLYAEGCFEDTAAGFTGTGYVVDKKVNEELITDLAITVEVDKSGLYAISMIYNNYGNATTTQEGGIRSILVDGMDVGTMKFPLVKFDFQRSSHLYVSLTAGTHVIEIRTNPGDWYDNNMNNARGVKKNDVCFDSLQLQYLGEDTLLTVKEAVIAELEEAKNALNADDYYEEQQAELDQILEEAVKNILMAESEEAIAPIREAAVLALDEVLTKSEVDFLEAKATVEAAQAAAEAAKNAAEAAQKAAETAQAEAAQDKTAADAAKAAAEAAKKLAEDAAIAAEAARDAALKADEEAVQEAVKAAQAASTAAESAAAAAEAAKTAQQAQTAAENAQKAAETAAAAAAKDQSSAESAAAAAQAAKSQAESAKAAADAAKKAADAAAAAAAKSDTEAAKSAAAAANSAKESAESAAAAAAAATAAADSAAAAALSQKKAEEAEAEAERLAQQAQQDQQAAAQAKADAEKAKEETEKHKAEAALNMSKTEALLVLDEALRELKSDANAEERANLAAASKAAREAITSAASPEELEQAIAGGNEALAKSMCNAKVFTDVNLDAWYHEPIDFVLANGMMTGDKEGTFRPDVNISRAQVAQILYNMAEDKTYEASKTFSDVKDGQWFYDAVMWAAANGFVLGDDGADTFRPDAPITRQELVVIIWRYMGKNAPANAELTFADAAEAESWAVEAIAWASENEFVKGLGDNKFAPKANASRAQMTQILMNIFG